jgi:hypothetical protein
MSQQPIYAGFEARLYEFLEATYGVGPTTEDMNEVYFTESIEPSVDPSLIKVRGIGSRDLAQIIRGLQNVTLKVVILPKPDLQSWIDYIVSNPDKSFTLEALYTKGANIKSLRHYGCRMNSVEMECEAEELLRATMTFFGQKFETATNKMSSGSYNTVPGDLTPWYNTYIKKAGVTFEKCVAWKFTVNENLKQVAVIPSGGTGYLLKYLQPRHREVTGELTVNFEDQTEFNEVVNDNEFSLEFGFGTSKKATLSNCKWSKITAPTGPEDLIAFKLPFVAKSIAFAAQ